MHLWIGIEQVMNTDHNMQFMHVTCNFFLTSSVPAQWCKFSYCYILSTEVFSKSRWGWVIWPLLNELQINPLAAYRHYTTNKCSLLLTCFVYQPNYETSCPAIMPCPSKRKWHCIIGPLLNKIWIDPLATCNQYSKHTCNFT